MLEMTMQEIRAAVAEHGYHVWLRDDAVGQEIITSLEQALLLGQQSNDGIYQVLIKGNHLKILWQVNND